VDGHTSLNSRIWSLSGLYKWSRSVSSVTPSTHTALVGVCDSHLVNKVLHHNGGFAVVAAIAKVFLVVRLVLDATEIAHAVDRVMVGQCHCFYGVIRWVVLTQRRRGDPCLGRRAAYTGAQVRGA
jgi:hypothetical protein